jgi:hypothetical protein
MTTTLTPHTNPNQQRYDVSWHAQTYLVIIFLDPLLRWFEKDNLRYHSNTSTTASNTITYKTFSEWAHLDLNSTKCAINRRPNIPKFKPHVFKAYIQAHNILLKTNPSPPKRKLTHTWAYNLSPYSNGNYNRHNNEKKILMTSPSIIAISISTYVGKWVFNEKINQKLSNHF